VRILIVEDSARVADTVGDALRAQGHAVSVAGGLRAADEACASEPFDLAIVDVGLPDGSGIDWCESARSSGSELPVLMLTARSGVADRIAGLDAGADDYLCKPFSLDELIARVRALGRRGARCGETARHFGVVGLDRDRRVVTVRGAKVPLTAREFDVVALLAWRDGRVVSRDELLESIWGEVSERAAGSLEVLLVRIRRKLAERGVRDALRTVRQVGYSWVLERSKHA
jgi:DNA-binding response OmpR family regulator